MSLAEEHGLDRRKWPCLCHPALRHRCVIGATTWRSLKQLLPDFNLSDEILPNRGDSRLFPTGAIGRDWRGIALRFIGETDRGDFALRSYAHGPLVSRWRAS